MAILPRLAGVVNRFKIPGGLTVLRRTAIGSNQFGEDLPPMEIPVPFDPISVQPLVGPQRLQFVAGDDTRESVLIFTRSKLQTAKEGTTDIADILLYDPIGEVEFSEYVIQSSEPWFHQSGHWRSIGLREERT